MTREPRCNHPGDYKIWPLGHAANTSKSRWSLWGKECPVHGPTARAAPRPEPKPKPAEKPAPALPVPPKQPDYDSVWSLNTNGESPVKTPVYEEVYNGGYEIQLRQTGVKHVYPHRDWIQARDSYALYHGGDPEIEYRLKTELLSHVTETNPPYVKSLVCSTPKPVEEDRVHDIATYFTYAAVIGCAFIVMALLSLLGVVA